MNGKSRRAATQSLENLRGEIEFRAKLAKQHVSGEVLLPDYYRLEEHDQILLERVETTHQKMKALKYRGVQFSPFLELGAERGQRSLVLTNDFGAEGIAIDISFHQLRTMDHYARLFQREKLPLRVCCDANHLPFRSNAFPFVFCYQFLHHFPSPGPVAEEIYRVLSDGYFYFAEEPFKRVLKFILFRQRDKIYSKRALRKNKYLHLLESFFSEACCDEVKHGIIENNDITLDEWINALATFDGYEADLYSIYNITSKLEARLQPRNFPNYLLGGSIAGLCRKKTPVKQESPEAIGKILACPSCKIPSENGTFDRPALIQRADGYQCSRCGFHYPWREGVLFLLPQAELRQLYPDL